MSARDKLIDVVLDESSLAAASANAAHERRIAMFDLIESNVFAVEGQDRGPYRLTLSTEDGRLHMKVSDEADAAVFTHPLPLGSFRRLIKDYFMICESYYAAIRDATPTQIEAIDMGRRGLHNEGADLLAKALEGKFKVDFETSRRLFTLICALHVRS
ncbi:MAG: UPF0262 family protein [Terricaulis silvestris]